jgi:hypothetical protein
MPAEDMFRSREQIEDVAYSRQAEKIAYVRSGQRSESSELISESDQSGEDL